MGKNKRKPTKKHSKQSFSSTSGIRNNSDFGEGVYQNQNHHQYMTEKKLEKPQIRRINHSLSNSNTSQHESIISENDDNYNNNHNYNDTNNNNNNNKPLDEPLTDRSSVTDDRWQSLFHSVLDQMRAQRSQQQQEPQTQTGDNFNKWKRSGEEKLRIEYMRQKSKESNRQPQRLYENSNSTNGGSLSLSSETTTPEPVSPDIVTVRL